MPFLPALAWPVGPVPLCGYHTVRLAYPRSATDTGVKTASDPDEYDWQSEFIHLYLLIRGELAKTPLLKVVELHVNSNFSLGSNI